MGKDIKLDIGEKHLIVIFILSFIIIRSFYIHPSFSDETFYFNVAKNVLEGRTPYIDFFFAHPPFQIYLLASVFKIFGANFFVAKIIPLIASSSCILLIYMITDELDWERMPSVFVFLTLPSFFAFSAMGYGMWECGALVLLSLLLMLKDNKKSAYLASIPFVLSIFTRYLSMLYLPMIIALCYDNKQKIKEFLAASVILFLLTGSALLLLFGEGFVDQTIKYHIFSKVSMGSPESQKMQYWNMGFFTIFLSTISAMVGYIEKDKKLMLLSIVPIIVDLTILFGINLIFYHYFLISVPLYSIAAGRAFSKSDEKIVKIIIPTILLLMILSNTQTIDFYLNPSHSENFYKISELIKENTSKNDTIFGEPIMVNYVSFSTGRRVSGNYMDSYLRHMLFENTTEVINNIESDTPEFIIDMDNYYSSRIEFDELFSKYQLKETFDGNPTYFVYERI